MTLSKNETFKNNQLSPDLQDFQHGFIKFALENKVLQFGTFELKVSFFLFI